MIVSIMVIPPGLVILATALVFCAIALVMGRARLRRRLLLSYACVGLLLFLATNPNIPSRRAAGAGAVGLVFLIAGPIVWLCSVGRELREMAGRSALRSIEPPPATRCERGTFRPARPTGSDRSAQAFTAPGRVVPMSGYHRWRRFRQRANNRTAKAMGLTIFPSLVFRADQILE